MKSGPRTLFLDDLEMGMEFSSSTHAMDREQIIRFASQFDPQPFHLDEDAAQDTFFQGLAASGWHTSSVSMKLLVESFPLSQGLIGAGGQLTWPSPTRPHDVLQVRSKITDIKPSHSKPDRGIVTLECRTLNQDGDLKQLMITKVLVFRKL